VTDAAGAVTDGPIYVCVKVVPREAIPLRIDPATLRLDRSAASEMNPLDAHAVEEALVLGEDAGTEVVALSMGPAEGAESLRTALAMGAARAVVAADPLLEGSDLLVTSRVLAELIEREAPRVVIFGAQSADSCGAMTSAAVAERLGWPLLFNVWRMGLDGDRVLATRQEPDVSVDLQASTPCVVALSGAMNVPRYPTFRDIVAAKRKPIQTAPVAELGLSANDAGWAGSGTSVLSVAPAPPRRAMGTIVNDDGDGARFLFDFLSERGLV
jgi:electron transfer flavoprotein beta subunit